MANVARRFRDAFAFPTKDITHFFPVHMAKGLAKMQRRLKLVDCVIEVHDARIPFSGRNPRFQETLAARPHILVLSKPDLAAPQHKTQVERLLLAQGVKRVLYANCRDESDRCIKHKLVPTILELVESGDRYNRRDCEDYNVMVIGIPNVGKSSLINTLRNFHLNRDGKATPVGAKPGMTRTVLEKIKVCEKPKIYIFDSPGIMCPNIPNMDIGMKLAMCATLIDHQVGEMTIVDYTLFWFNRHGHFNYVQRYGLPDPTDNVLELLTYVAKQQNMVIKQTSTSGGYVYRPDFTRAAQIVLSDFRQGFLGRINLDIDVLHDADNSKHNTQTVAANM